MVKELSILKNPKEVVIEVTSNCNFKCSGCFNNESFAKFGRNPELPTNKVLNIIESSAKAQVELIRFTGGEALLWKDLIPMILYAKSLGLKTRLNSNASLITPQFINAVENSLDSILVSVNGSNAKEDEIWTNIPNSFQSKLKGLELISNSKIKLRIGTVLTENNIDKLQKIFDIIQSFKLSHFEVYRLISSDQYEIISDKIETVLIKLAHLSNKFGNIIPIANAIPFCIYDKKTLHHFCPSGASWDDGHSRLIVDPRGFIKPSYYINENLGSTENIEAAWSHPFLEKMHSLQFLPNECSDCEFKNICKGGSRFKAFSRFGNYSAIDPLMKIN